VGQRQRNTAINAQFAPTAGLPAASSARRRILRNFWYGRSLRLQLLVVFALVDLLAALLSSSVMILRARAQTRIEIAASVRLAELLVGDAAKFASQQVTAEEFLRTLPTQLRSMRHVRIAVEDATGIPVTATLTLRGQERPPAPGWFAALVAPAVEVHVVPVTVAGEPIGQVEIRGEPSDEIGEVWENFIAIGSIAALLNFAMIAILYILLGRVLDPLTGLAAGLSDLQHNSYAVRLPQPYPRELAVIVNQFNGLANALENTRAENIALNRQLIRAQDDERRRTALELHDEVGPCLFGLKVCASSIAAAATELPDKFASKMYERAGEIVGTVEHLQAINRSMLERLRPMALGNVPLKEIINRLVSERARQAPQISFRFRAEQLAASYGDSVDLTVYRCIQESLTNALRHAHAKHVNVEICEDRAANVLKLIVRDDGRGMAADAAVGLGISGMQERVEGLGGRYGLQSQIGGGTCVNIIIPLGSAETAFRSDTKVIGEAP